MTTDITIIDETEIDAPAAAVWEVLSDYSRDPEWRIGVVSMTAEPAGPARPGTRTIEQLRFGGRTYRNVGVLESVDDMSISWRTIEGARAHGRRELRSLGPERCLVRLELVVQPKGAERLLAVVLGRMLRRNLHGDLVRLGRLVADRDDVAVS
jgi:uncharacterized membrane protein